MRCAMADTSSMTGNGSWLAPTEGDRSRMLDMEKRLRAALPVVYGSVGAVLLASVPALGWLPVAVLAFALLHYVLIRRRHARSSRPEWWSAWYFAACQALIGVAIAASGGPTSPLIAWPLIAAATLPLRFTSRGGVAGLLFTTLVVLAATAGVDPAGFVREPTLVLMTLAVLASVAAFSSTLMRSELDHRSESVLDPLTGLLNRRALDARLEGLGRRAPGTPEPVCLILCDLDRFKEINDSHGHASGDAVIRAAADGIRGQLRSFESAYRIGGDEFLVLLPGVDAARGRAVAERLRLAVAGSLPELAVTASLGVSAVTATTIDGAALLRDADRGLYRAKALGGNRVGSSPDRELAPSSRGSAPFGALPAGL